MTQKFRSRLELHSIINGQPAKQILAKAADVAVTEELNGDYFVSFLYPKLPDDSDRYEGLIEDNEVKFPDGIERGQRFVIKDVNEVREGLRIYKRVVAYHVAFRLGQYFLDDFVDFAANKPPEYLLGLIGNETPFTFTVEGSFPNQDVFNFGEDSKLALLNQTRELYGAERSFDNYGITLTTRKGGNHGVEIRYKKNLTGIIRKSHSMERITRLYGYGKNGLTIEGHAGHTTKYIDSQYFDAANPYMGKVEFPEIDEQPALLAAMERHLKTVELPKVAYEIDFVQLEKVDIEFKADAIREVGDTVTVIDEPMGYRFDARVHRFERYPFEPKRGRVVLANFRELSNGDVLFRATVAGKQAMVYTSKNAVLKGEKYDDSITLVDGLGMRISDDFNRELIRLGQTGPGEYGMAMYNKSGNKTIWQDAATGNAKFSGTLEAAAGTFSGSLQAASGTFAGTLQAVDGTFTGNLSAAGGTFTGTLQGVDGTFSGTVSAGTIIGGTVNGSFINGGTIVASTVKTAGTTQHVALEPGGLRSYDNTGTKRISIDTTDAFGYQELRFFGQSGGHSGTISGTNGLFNITAQPGSSLIVGGNTFVIATNLVDFQDTPVINFPQSNVDGLTSRLASIESRLSALESATP
ncbi:phage tail protein [Paenibacillus sp. J5C_2022]|uniref:phage tail spike protein n=1 Tax=Paenibacillus sp. J5C2022 TaxID=2977129 RepID=UPI0021D33C6E|nr:phage tail spike protein [Paenibacillus sp. J5C2022]MCU6709777.1 phage tail protein [Paenibacillus sp. J5C2022]